MQSIYEQSGGTYHQNGDYLIPDIVLPQQSEASIGTWGVEASAVYPRKQTGAV